jgi:hypothetical protein
LRKKLIRLHTPDLDEAALTALVRRLTTELYSHSHLITRTEVKALGLPVELPSEHLEERMLAYYELLKADLRLLERFDPGALDSAQERAYIESPRTCDAYATRAGDESASDSWVTIA